MPMPASKQQQLINKLLESEGLPTSSDGRLRFMEQWVHDSVCPAICYRCMEYTAELEPDQHRGFCEECKTNTMVSGLVLLGVI